jgi:pyroglutamyl-peptidase
MSILLTGFEPFGGAETNPSWEAVCLVPDTIGGHAVHRLHLPVEFARAASLLREEIARLRPEIVISVGVANGRKAVTPELVAINYRFASIPDNAGVSHQGDPIVPDGPAACMTTLPVHDMIAAINEAGIPAHLSLSAGAYVCNDVYYALLSCEKEFGHKGLFVHVPGTEIFSVEDMARALEICLLTAI